MTLIACPCGAEVIPGDRWTEADAAAWRAEHAGHSPARTLADDVRETLKDIECNVRPMVLGNGARVEFESKQAKTEAIARLAGFELSDIGYVLFVRAKDGGK